MDIQLDNLQQKAAFHDLSNGKILKGGTGSGKSRTAVAYFFTQVCGGHLRVNGVGDVEPLTHPRDLYIFTTAKKRDDLDWEKTCGMFALSKDPNRSYCGVRVTVDSWNNITKYTDVQDAFFIFDEQRLVGSGAWVKAFYKIAKSNQWIVLTARRVITGWTTVRYLLRTGSTRTKPSSLVDTSSIVTDQSSQRSSDMWRRDICGNSARRSLSTCRIER